jgi:hypothetical protein
MNQTRGFSISLITPGSDSRREEDKRRIGDIALRGFENSYAARFTVRKYFMGNKKVAVFEKRSE